MEIEVRMESGTTLEDANIAISSMEDLIRREVGGELEQLISNIGVFYDLPAAYTPNSGTQDAFIGIQLKKGHVIASSEYATKLRALFHQGVSGSGIQF